MIIVLLPAYNEEESLPNLMPKIKPTLSDIDEDCRVIVCNDSSRDRTSETLKEYADKMPVRSLSTRSTGV